VPVFYSLFEDTAESPAWQRIAAAGRRASAPLARLVGRHAAAPAGEGVRR
jgi:hypothetical protein